MSEYQRRERLARLRHLEDVHAHQDEYWRRIDEAVERGSGGGYDDAAKLLVDLRDVAEHFHETLQFEQRFRVWAGRHLRRPAFVWRLREQRFALPEG